MSHSIHSQKSITLLDGGTGTELQRSHGFVLTAPLWSSIALRENREAVREVHRAYLRAGAKIVETATFRSNPHAYSQVGLSRQESWNDTVLAATLAREVVCELKSSALVAGSIAPVRDSYSTEAVTHELMHDNHLTQARALKAGRVDLLMFETIPAIDEARHMLNAAEDVQLPFIMSFTVGQDGRLLDQKALSEAALTTEHKNRVAVGVNCSRIQDADKAVRELLASGYRGTIAIYANGISETEGPQIGGPNELGWQFTEDGQRFDAAHAFVKASLQLVKLVRDHGNDVIIGGCCGITPHEISLLSKALATNDLGYSSTSQEIVSPSATPLEADGCCTGHGVKLFTHQYS